MNYFEKIENGILFRQNGEVVRVRAWGNNSLRTECVSMGEIPQDSDALLEPKETAPEILIESEYAEITNGKIRAELSIAGWHRRLHICYKNTDGRILLSEKVEGDALNKKARNFRSLSGDLYYLKAVFEGGDEKIYGMGQYQQEIMDLKGCSLELSHRNSQASVPFYLSTRGYGFLWNNAAIGDVHFNKNSTEWESRSTKKLDYWITAGDSPREIEQAYADAVGHAPMMPEYGLGFWQCKLRYYSQKEVLEIAREYKKRNIPVDVLVIDFYHWPRCGDWRFDETYFPDPAAMVKELSDMGIETMVSVWPQVDQRSENFAELNQQGLLVRSKSGENIHHLFHGNNAFMDATNPRARRYVWEKIRKNYADYGIHTFWLDEAEPEYGTYDYEQYRYYAGSVLEKGNIYPREFARLFYEGEKENGQELAVNLLRCAWAGSQRYGALVWSGDIHSSYEDFRKQICAGLHMGLAGIPWWTTDIGGFSGGDITSEKFHELLIRWFQYGAFCPVMRIHGCRLPYSKVEFSEEGTGASNEVWSYGEENERIMTKFIGIREMLRNYTRALYREASENGSPLMRPLFYEFPKDDRTYDITDEYLYGPDILVAPVCHEGERSRNVYLPEGASWTLASTGEVYEGGSSYEIQAPIDTLPIFLRDGKQAYLIGKI